MAEYDDVDYQGSDDDSLADLQAAVAAEISDAIDYIDENVTPERVRNIEAYKMALYGTEEQGRSDYVDSSVRDVIQSLMPPLLRTFTGAERVCDYVPTSKEDIPMAEQATDVVHQILKNNNFFSVCYAAFKDALLAKTGIIKYWYDESITVTEHSYSGLSEPEIAMLLEADNVSLVELVEELTAEQVVNPDGMIQVVSPALFGCTIRREEPDGKYCVEAVPPEEFLVDRRSRTLDDASLVAHRQILTVSDLIAMGYDAELINDNASTDNDLEFNEEAEERYDTAGSSVSRSDDEGKKALYIEAYIRWPNADGIAELTKVCCLGSAHKIVNQESVSDIPFAIFCPDPTPHTIIGNAIDVTDLQATKSEIMRDCLDSLSQSIHPRTAIVEGAVNLADVQNNETGAIIRMRAPGMVQSLSTPFVGQSAFPMIEYLDSVKEARTGVTKLSQGMNAEALQSTTKVAVNSQIQAAQARVEVIARIFSEEPGMKRLFRGLLRLISTHQNKPMIMRLRNEYVEIDPRVWETDFDVEVNVALSDSSIEERMQVLATIIAKQESIMGSMGPNNPLVTLGQYRNTLAKTIELAGFKDASMFFNELPTDFQMPPPQQESPSPEQLLAEVERESIVADIEKKKAQLMLDQEKMVREDDRARDKLESDIMLRAAELQAKYNTSIDVASIKANVERDRELVKQQDRAMAEQQEFFRAQQLAEQQAVEQQMMLQQQFMDEQQMFDQGPLN